MKILSPTRLFMLLLTSVGVCVVVFPTIFASHNAQLTRAAAIAASREDWSEAAALTEAALSTAPNDALALTIAAVAIGRLHDDARAGQLLTYAENLANTSLAPVIQMERAKRQKSQGMLAEAERSFRTLLENSPDNIEAHRNLSEMLAFQGRAAEATQHLLIQIQSGTFTADQLLLLGSPGRIVVQDERLCRQLNAQGDGSLAQLGSIRNSTMAEILPASHETMLFEITEKHPELALPHALLGLTYLKQDRMKDVVAWERGLPASVRQHAEIWFNFGVWAKRINQPTVAIRCFLETLQQDPNHVPANFQLSQLFQQVGAPQQATHFSERSLLLSKLAFTIHDLQETPDAHLMHEAVEILSRLGRNWEAAAWCDLSARWTTANWTDEELNQLRKKAVASSGQFSAGFHPLDGLNIESYPKPNWSDLDLAVPTQSETTPVSSLPEVEFQDVADLHQLNFQYFSSMNPDVGPAHILQTMGGGVAVIDFDGDLWPDVYFANGAEIPESMDGFNIDHSEHTDILFRNNRGTGFHQVSDLAGLHDGRLSHGVSSGDYDNDGFADLYICNAGGNRLYRNNGDGTFEEALNGSETNGKEWTMSAMIADVDADGLPDIYAVNYLQLDDVLNRWCLKDGEPFTCAPTLFNAAQDRLYKNAGDGTFKDVTDEYGVAYPNGKGLGVVGLRRDGHEGLQIFVANDTSENLFFEFEKDTEGRSRFRENGLLAGLAMSEAGNIQGCMGVAAGDSNLDGHIDLFVTNFYADYNTLYQQPTPGIFTDATRQSGMLDSGIGLVGFGTQFLDADNDGDRDILITNGHVDPATATGQNYLMPTQLFLNNGQGRFSEVRPETADSFFARKNLGRALARLDWNADGTEDAIVVPLDAPAALLTNTSSGLPESVSVRIRGTSASRDAVGTSITATIGARQFTQQLTAGDGYQATNEKMITFGLGKNNQIETLKLQWSNCSEESSGPAKGGQMFLFVESQGIFQLTR